MKTFVPKKAEMKRKWFLVDAQGQVLGRTSTVIAGLLTGKRKTIYSPHVDCGDHVVVINAAKVVVTGNKLRDKMYYSHSGYPGGFKERSVGVTLQKAPDKVFLHAVKGMLPKSRLGRKMLTKLRVYPGAEHPHAAQGPVEVKIKPE